MPGLMTGGGLGSIAAYLDIDTKNMVTGAASAQSIITGVNTSMTGMEERSVAASAVVGKAFMGLGAVTAIIGVAAGKMADDFDVSMRKVWSLTEESEATFGRWKKQIMELSSDLPQSAKDMAEAFYWIKSDMPDATDAEQMRTLEVAARGAVGGVAELSDTTEALIQAQNAYKTIAPERFMDVMNKAVERGSITLQDFVSNQGKYIGSAALANISIEETSAAMAVLTRNAVPADVAAMALNQTVMGFLKPGTEATDVARKYGIELSLAALRSKGLGGAMMEIAEKIPDEELANLFPNVRALKAVLPLGSIAAAEFAYELNQTADAAGTSGRMFERNAGSVRVLAAVIKGKVQNLFIVLGEKILPTVANALEAVGRAIDGKNDTFNTLVSIIGTGANLAWDLVGALKEVWPLLVGIGVAAAAIKLQAMFAGALSTMPLLTAGIENIGMGFVRTSMFFSIGGQTMAQSLGAISLAAAPAAIGLGLLINKWKDADRAGEKAWKTIRDNDKAMAGVSDTLSPLIQKYYELKNSQDGSAEKAEALRKVQNDIAGISPMLVDNIDAQGNAWLKADDELNDYLRSLARFRGYSIETEGPVAEYEKLAKSQDRISTGGEEIADVMERINSKFSKLVDKAGGTTVSLDDVSTVMQILSSDVDAGEESLQSFIQMMEDAGNIETWSFPTEGITWFGGGERGDVEGIKGDIEELRTLYEKYGITAAEVQKAQYEATQEMLKSKPALLDIARSAGQAGTALDDNFITALRSNVTQFSTLGNEALQNYIWGMMQTAGTATPQLEGAMQQMVGQLSSGNLQQAWNTAGQLGIQSMSAGIIAQFVSNLGPQINMAAGQIPDGISWALRSGIPEVQAAANALVVSTVIPQIQAAVPQISFATGKIPEAIVNGLNNGSPEIRQATADAMTSILQQFAADQGLVGPEADKLVNTIKEHLKSGDYSDTGSAAGNAILLAIGQSLGKKDLDLSSLKKKLQQQLSEGAFVKFTEQAGPAGEEAGSAAGGAAKKGITKGIEQGASDGIARADKIVKGWSPPAKTLKITPSLTMKEIYISAKIVGSGPFTTAEYARYLDDTISGVSPQIQVGIAGGTAGVQSDALAHVMDIFGGNIEGGFLWENMHAQFREVEDAIMAITGQSGAHLEAWRALRGEYDAASAELEQYNAQLDASQDRVEALQREQTKLNEVIQESQEKISAANSELSKMSQMKLVGETAADETSYQMGLQLDKLDAERKALEYKLNYGKGTAADLDRLREIEDAQERLQAEKELYDLNKKITYEPQHREIDASLDSLHGEEMTQQQILDTITKQQGVIAEENKKIAEKQERLKQIKIQLDKEWEIQWKLKVEIENTQKVVDALRARIDEFANYFIQRYHEMQQEAQELARQMEQAGGGTVTVNTQYQANPIFDTPSQLAAYVNRTLGNKLNDQFVKIMAPLPDMGVLTGKSGGATRIDQSDNSSSTQILHIENVNVYGAENLDDILEDCRRAQLKSQVISGDD